MAEDFYSIRFSADPVQLTFFRYGLGKWLQSLRWPEAELDEVVLAVSEACTNSVQHAYEVGCPGDVEVVGRLVLGGTRRRVAVTVRDWGSWRSETGGNGYGLVVVRGCMERVTVRHDADGTVVTMLSRPVPAIGTTASPAGTGHQGGRR